MVIHKHTVNIAFSQNMRSNKFRQSTELPHRFKGKTFILRKETFSPSKSNTKMHCLENLGNFVTLLPLFHYVNKTTYFSFPLYCAYLGTCLQMSMDPVVNEVIAHFVLNHIAQDMDTVLNLKIMELMDVKTIVLNHAMQNTNNL